MSDADVVAPRTPDSSVDDLFDALSHGRRRDVLASLRSMDGDAAELSELVDRVLAREVGDADARRDEVAVALHHIHLPKLADCGLVDYDARSRTVRYGRHPKREERVALALEPTEVLS